MPEIKIIDTTLRDAHQCLWATRMTTAMSRTPGFARTMSMPVDAVIPASYAV